MPKTSAWQGLARAEIYLSTCCLLLAMLAPPVAAGTSAALGDFYRTRDMGSPRTWHTATLLADGRVLIAGGSFANNDTQLATAEIYDPAKGTYEPTGSMHDPRWGHTAVRLADGKVLVAGGWISSFRQPTSNAEIYDPATGQFTRIGDMSIARGDVPPIVPGCDGKWLVIGGTTEGNLGTGTTRIDRFDPVTNTFAHVADLLRARRDHAVVALPNGQLLVLGGLFDCCNTIQNDLRRQSAELLSSCGTGASLLSSSLLHPRTREPQARLTSAGNVMIVGGSGGPHPLELYQPGSGTFQLSDVEDLFDRRARATELEDGTFLITGLEAPVLAAAAVYDPATDSVRRTGQGLVLSDGHAAVRLADGRVLVTGGRHPTLGTLAAGAIYDPEYRPGAFLTHMPIESIPGLRSPRISSVLDHHVPRTGVPASWRSPYTCTSPCNSVPAPCAGISGELQVKAYDGQLGDAIFGANEPPAGYRKSCLAEAFDFSPFDYVGSSGQVPPQPCGSPSAPVTYLNYDGHPGYDFAYGDDEWIVAAADGWLDRPEEDFINSPCSGNPSQFNQLRIRHAGGLETWYVHAALLSECGPHPALCPAPGSGPVFVKGGDRIARVGNTGTVSPHLHFEVRRTADQQIVDPFGCSGAVRSQDLAACLTGESLWVEDLFRDGFESGSFTAWSTVLGGP